MTTGWPRRDGQVEGRAVEGRCRRRGGAASPTAAFGPPRIEPATSTTTTVVTRRDGEPRAGSVDAAWRTPAYWRVAVPVMFEWIVQTNVYEPAGSDGTS